MHDSHSITERVLGNHILESLKQIHAETNLPYGISATKTENGI